MADEVTIKSRDRVLSGWKTVRITSGVEICPNSFDLTATERYPAKPKLILRPGDPIELFVGNDRIIVGYVDRYNPSISPHGHEIRISGRGKCQDLVDCAAVWPSNQITSTSMLDIATKLAEPYGIKVTSSQGAAGSEIVQLNINLTDTCWSIIEEVARYSGYLPFEGRDGNLILSRLGTRSMASGFKQGVNVQSASAMNSADERYTEIIGSITSSASLGDISKAVGTPDATTTAAATDPTFPLGFDNVPRFRRKVIVSEAVQDGENFVKLRVNWEMARRVGRSQAITIETDSWRDSAGHLWEPGADASITIPSLGFENQTWVISEVTLTKDMERGTVASLTMMPRVAFTPEPVLLYQGDAQVYHDLNDGKAGGAS